LNGFSYQDQKNQTFKAAAGDLIISAYQSSALLIQALLDPTPVLEDSVTYDITAWNLFKLHGIRAYGVREKLNAIAWNEVEWKDNVLDES